MSPDGQTLSAAVMRLEAIRMGRKLPAALMTKSVIYWDVGKWVQSES